jgi:hypothetical protein
MRISHCGDIHVEKGPYFGEAAQRLDCGPRCRTVFDVRVARYAALGTSLSRMLIA